MVLFMPAIARAQSFDGTRWDADGENAVKEALKQLADALTVYALRDIKDESKRAEYLKFAAKWQQLRQRETIAWDTQTAVYSPGRNTAAQNLQTWSCMPASVWSRQQKNGYSTATATGGRRLCCGRVLGGGRKKKRPPRPPVLNLFPVHPRTLTKMEQHTAAFLSNT